MFTPSEMAARISECAEEKGISVRALLMKADLGRNTLTHLRGGSSIGYDSLGKIALILGCSMDYLAGLSDVPNMEQPAPDMDDRERNLIEHFRALDLDGKASVEHTAVEEHRRVRLEGDSEATAN